MGKHCSSSYMRVIDLTEDPEPADKPDLTTLME